MTATTISKCILVVTAVAFILYVVGFASPYWLQKDFVLKVPGSVLNLPAPLDKMIIEIEISSNMGLLKSCKDQTIKIPQHPKSETDCSSDGAADWQTISAGLGIAALVLAFISLGLCLITVFLPKLHGCKNLRASVIVVDFVTAGLILSCLIIYVINKKIQVNPPLPDQIDYSLHWAYYVTAASGALFALLILFNVLDIVWSKSNTVLDITKEPSVAYTK